LTRSDLENSPGCELERNSIGTKCPGCEYDQNYNVVRMSKGR